MTPKRGFYVVKGLNRSGRGECEFKITVKRVTHLETHGPTNKFYELLSACDVLRSQWAYSRAFSGKAKKRACATLGLRSGTETDGPHRVTRIWHEHLSCSAISACFCRRRFDSLEHDFYRVHGRNPRSQSQKAVRGTWQGGPGNFDSSEGVATTALLSRFTNCSNSRAGWRRIWRRSRPHCRPKPSGGEP